MSVVVVGTPDSSTSGTASTHDRSYALDGAANGLGVAVHWRDATTITSVVWDQGGSNQALTSCGAAASDADAQKTQLFYLVAPITGTRTLRVTFSGNTSFKVVGILGLSGLHQSTPISGYQSGTATSGASPATITDVSSAVGDLVFSAISADDAVDVTAQNQTAAWELVDNFVALRGAGGYASGATTVNPEWTYGANATWSMASINFVQAVGGGGDLNALIGEPITGSSVLN